MRKSFILLVAFLLVVVAATGAAPASADAARQVFAVYYGWWTQDSWTGGQLLDSPLTPYDVRDPSTAAAQIQAAQAVGIDGFIVDWVGVDNDNITHQTLQAMLDAANQLNFKIAVMVDLNERNYLQSGDNVSASLDYVVNQAMTQPSYARVDGKPIVYFWNEDRFALGTWISLRQQYDPNYQQIWMMEGTNQAYMPTFDGMYMMDVAWAQDPGQMFQYWQDRIQMMGAQYFQPTVIPGWDASSFAGWDPRATPPRDRANGQFLSTYWNAAVQHASQNVILVNSWNGYYEDSQVEPSAAFGTQTTDLLHSLIATWKGL